MRLWNTNSERIVAGLKVLCVIIGIFILVNMLQGINYLFTRPIEGYNNDVSLDCVEDAFYVIKNIENASAYVDLNLVKSSPDDMQIIFDNMEFEYEILIDDLVVKQNIKTDSTNYSDDFSYVSVSVFGNEHIRVRGEAIQYTNIYIVKSENYHKYMQIRTFTYSFLFIGFFLMGVFNLFIYIHSRKSYHFLMMFLVAFIINFKIITMGELFYLQSLIGITVQNSKFWGSMPGIINFFFPILALVYYSKLQVTRGKKIIIALFCSVLLYITRDHSAYRAAFLTLLFSVCFAYIYILYKIFMKRELSSREVFAMMIPLGGGTIYKAFVDGNIFENGSVDVFFHSTGYGCLIFLAVFFWFYIKQHMNKVNALLVRNQNLAVIRGAGHDFKIPLSVIKSGLQIIEGYDLSSEERKKYLHTSLASVDELTLMIDNMSSYLKTGHKLNESSLDLLECLKQIVEHIHLYNGNKEYELLIEIDIITVNLNIPYMDLYRVIMNLVDNAFKYTSPGGQVGLRVVEAKENVEIHVSDSGCGIESCELNRIFDQFYRVSIATNAEGYGLGLSVVKEIVNRNKGQIKVESTLGRGSVFKVIFPKTSI